MAHPVAVVGLLHLELHVADARSLKDKRTVLRSIKDRIRKLNVAVAEVDHQDLWQRARLDVVAIGTAETNVGRALDAVVEAIERHDPEVIVGADREWLA